MAVKVSIQEIDHSAQRYNTVGDWYPGPAGWKMVLVSKMSDRRLAKLIAIHELIEMWCCEEDGITSDMVDDWDFNHENYEDEEYWKGCPYRDQHLFAESIERMLADRWGVIWDKYGDVIEEMSNFDLSTRIPVT
jgi:hypothetical protein